MANWVRYLGKKRNKMLPKCSLVNEFSATPRGQLNWTGPIANSSNHRKWEVEIHSLVFVVSSKYTGIQNTLEGGWGSKKASLRRTQEGCGGLRGENPAVFPKARPIFQQPFSLPESAQTLAGIAVRAAGKSVRNFPAASKFARKLFQQGILDSHSLLEFSESLVVFMVLVVSSA